MQESKGHIYLRLWSQLFVMYAIAALVLQGGFHLFSGGWQRVVLLTLLLPTVFVLGFALTERKRARKKA